MVLIVLTAALSWAFSALAGGTGWAFLQPAAFIFGTALIAADLVFLREMGQREDVPPVLFGRWAPPVKYDLYITLAALLLIIHGGLTWLDLTIFRTMAADVLAASYGAGFGSVLTTVLKPSEQEA